MIQAAINPQTGEFLGLVVPKEDLLSVTAIHGSAEDWEKLLRGQPVDPHKVKVIVTTAEIRGANVTISVGKIGGAVEIEPMSTGGHVIDITAKASENYDSRIPD